MTNTYLNNPLYTFRVEMSTNGKYRPCAPARSSLLRAMDELLAMVRRAPTTRYRIRRYTNADPTVSAIVYRYKPKNPANLDVRGM